MFLGLAPIVCIWMINPTLLTIFGSEAYQILIPGYFAAFRALRLVRLLKADSQTRQIVEALVASLPELIGVIKLCALFLFIWGLGANKTFGVDLPEDFGNILIAMESMLAASVFINTDVISAANQLQPFMGRFLFAMNTLTVTFVGFNLVISVLGKYYASVDPPGEQPATSAEVEALRREVAALRELLTRKKGS